MPISTINSRSIADGTVIAADILDGTISTSKLVASNIAGDRIAANTLSNTVFQTGSVENYLRASSGGALSGRNRIINGAMVIDQRNAGASVTPGDGTYTLDRFLFYVSQSAKLTCQQNAGSVTPPAGFSNYLGVTSSSSYSVVTADYFGLRHVVEGFNFADMAWGTANAKTVTLSFWVRSSLTGTFGGSLANGAGDRSYPFSYTISTSNTWEQKIITIPGDTTGTWVGATNGFGLRVNFGLGAGSTYSGTAGSWAGTNYSNTTGAVSVVGTNAATWYITGIQLEAGSSATPFEYRQYGTELQLCQRYYQKNYVFQQVDVGYWMSYFGGTNTVAPLQNTFLPMRATPTGTTINSSIEYYSFSGVWTATTLLISTCYPTTFYLYAAADGDGRGKLMRPGSGGTAGSPIYVLNAEL